MNYLHKIKAYVIAHKVISAVVVILLLSGGYYTYKKETSTTGEVRYVTAEVTKGTIVSSVTGSGQVSASDEVDIKPTVSGAITYLGIQPGSKVGEGQTIATIDDTDAEKTVRDAQISLDSANISLSKLQIQNSSDTLSADSAQDYDSAFNTISNVFLDLPGVMSGLNDMFFKSSITTNGGQWNIDWYEAQVDSTDVDAVKPYKQAFQDSYNAALKAYTDNFSQYQLVSRTSDNTTIDALLSQTYNTSKLISDAIKDANNYIDFVNNSIKKRNTNVVPTIIATNQSTLNDYTNKVNGHLSDLLSTENTLTTDKNAVPNANLDLQSEQLDITQKENSLQDAKDQLANYTIRAPFSGTITAVPVKKGDNVSSGTALGTIITSSQIATISLNEVDIAKIQLGQKTTLTFDAVPDLTITGKVVQIDSIGTVSQGVVNYSVEISFDTTDSRIKPGMSVSAAIITGIEQDVLTVPNGAVKTQAGASYVQMFDAPLAAPFPGVQGSTSLVPPRQQPVTVGVSNDTSTEIVSGLNEGDSIVTRTITPTTTTTTTAPSILGSTGARGAGGIGGGAARPTGR